MSCRTTSGGTVSTSLARAVSGLSDKEIQHIFHALKREGSELSPPSELDVSAWRVRQYELLARMKRMTDNRKDKLRARLFRSKGEPVPDGATFYAWSRVEARARQEAALRTIQKAVDLDPPGSQAHLYDLGEDGRPTRVWYASYGSNMHRDRFMNYLEGGSPEGSTRVYDGCTDTTPPEGDIPIRFAGARPHFALTSRVWNGGIAFIDQQDDDPMAHGLGRAYNISISQFDEVVTQENGLPTKWASPVPLDEALETGRSVVGSGTYETVLHIGDYQGAPVLTFTAPFSAEDAVNKTGFLERVTTNTTGQKPTSTPVRVPVRTNKPSAAYLRMIGSGLGETFGMDQVAQADYLRGCPGGDRWTRQQMVRILRGETPDPPAPKKPAKKNTKTTTTTKTSKTTTKSGAKAGKAPVAEFSHSQAAKNPTPKRTAAAKAEEVRTYGSVEAQRRAVSRLEQHATLQTAMRDSVAAQVEKFETSLGTLSGARKQATEENLAGLRQRLVTADRLVADAERNLQAARAQKPSRFYSDMGRSRTEWMEEAERVLGAHRNFESTLAQVERKMSAASDADEFAQLQRRAERVRGLLREQEHRLAELDRRVSR